MGREPIQPDAGPRTQLRVVTDPAREVEVRDRLLREAIRLATAVSETRQAGKPVFPTGRALRLLSAATAYLDVMRPNGETDG